YSSETQNEPSGKATRPSESMPLTLLLVSMKFPLKSMAISPVPPKPGLLGRPFIGLPAASRRRIDPMRVSAPLASWKWPIWGVKFGMGKALTFCSVTAAPAACVTGAGRVTWNVIVVAVALTNVAVIVSDCTWMVNEPKAAVFGNETLAATVICVSLVPMALDKVVVG